MVESLPIKHHSLTGRIDLELMHAAFRAVKRNKGKAGVDRVSIEMFAQHLDQNLLALMRDLKQGSFQPLPVRRAYIDKGGGKLRPLGIPVVRSRLFLVGGNSGISHSSPQGGLGCGAARCGKSARR